MRLLLARAGALGDVLLLRRAIGELGRLGWSVDLLASPVGEALVGAGPASVTRLLPWEAAETAPLWVESAPVSPGLLERLAEYRAAIVYSGEPTLPRRLAESIPRVECHAPLPPPDFRDHASLWACVPVGRFGGTPRPPEPLPLRPRPGADASVRSLRHRLGTGFVALHPGSGAARKNWPAERFRALGRALSAGRPWLVSLGPAERTLPFAEGAGDTCLVASELPLPALAALLSEAALYVGNDSGVTHLAAALGVPTLALFGPTEPGTWAPVGPRVRVLRAPSGRMASLELQAVLRVAVEMSAVGPRLQV